MVEAQIKLVVHKLLLSIRRLLASRVLIRFCVVQLDHLHGKGELAVSMKARDQGAPPHQGIHSCLVFTTPK